MFKENLIAQGVEPGAELSVIDPNQVKIFIMIIFIIEQLLLFTYIFLLIGKRRITIIIESSNKGQ